jgi:hypothetical protein
LGRTFLERFRRSSPPPQRAASKVDAQKSKTQIPQNGRLDRRRENADGRRRIGQARRKLERTSREIVRTVERPKLTVYPIKSKRYFNIVQQPPVNFYRFASFFYLFHFIADTLLCLFYPKRLFYFLRGGLLARRFFDRFDNFFLLATTRFRSG